MAHPPANATRFAVLGLFFLSGISGLIDQVIWVRHVSLAFGSTVQSAALVTSIFLGGLGVGALLAGKWADNQTASAALKAYAVSEFAIAVLGVFLAFALPWLAHSGGWSVDYTVASNGWYTIGPTAILLRALLVAVLLGPSALLMGATLTLLIRSVVDVEEAGWWIGWLYGLNTLGAALGALSTDLWLVPSLGLRGTLFAAAGLNILVAMGASILPIQGQRVASPVEANGNARRVALALFLAGFAAMGVEMAWFRFLGGALGPYRTVFSTLLAVMLVGLFIGAISAGALVSRFGRPGALFSVFQVAFAALTLWAFATFDPEDLVRSQLSIAPQLAQASLPGARRLLLHVNGGVVAGLIFLPSIAMGASFPLGNAMVQSAESSLGTQAGWLYLATTLGNVLGALTVGFLWLPTLGIQSSVLALGLIATIAPLCLGRSGLGALTGLLAVGAFATLPAEQLLWATFPANRVKNEGVLAIHEGVEQILVITGQPEGPARLWTGGHPMTSTSPHAQRYMRLMAHVPLLMQDEPKSVAVICFGVGNTLSAAALHPSVETLHAVDLSADILAQGHWFEHANHGILDDPRLRVHVNDGRHHLRSQPNTYDLITLEPPPIAHAGVSALYSVEFYETARSRLAPDGLLTQWLPAYQVSEDTVRQMTTAFAQVFPENAILVASGREFVLVGSTGAAFALADVNRRIAERPEVSRDLAAIGAPNATELAAMYAGTLVPLNVAALIDDRPSPEYSQVSHVMETQLPPEIFDVTTLASWCADCPDDPHLQSILRLTGSLYQTADFLRYSNLLNPSRTSSFDWSGEGADVDIVTRSTTLQHLLFAPAALLERAMVLRQSGDQVLAWRTLDAAVRQAPSNPQIQDVRAAWQNE